MKLHVLFIFLLAVTCQKTYSQVIDVGAVDSVDIYIATDLYAFEELYSCQYASNNIDRGGYRDDELTIIKLRNNIDIKKFHSELRKFIRQVNFMRLVDFKPTPESPYGVIFYYRANYKHELCICNNGVIELNGVFIEATSEFRAYIDSFALSK